MERIKNDIYIDYVTSYNEKLKVLKECDEVFIKSVCVDRDFEELLKKIDLYAKVIVARIDGEIVGYVVFYDNNTRKKTAYITLICVKNKFRGYGVGKKLIDTCVEISRMSGMNSIKLEVDNSNEQAQKLYMKNGFVFGDKASAHSRYMNRLL